MATVGEAKVEVVGGVEWWPHVVEGEGGRQGDLEPLPGQQGGVGVGPLACQHRLRLWSNMDGSWSRNTFNSLSDLSSSTVSPPWPAIPAAAALCNHRAQVSPCWPLDWPLDWPVASLVDWPLDWPLQYWTSAVFGDY